MSNGSPLFARALTGLGGILVSGADAHAFLQGQVSFDMDRLSPERLELAACSSPQGRVQALPWMVQRSEGILLILPTALVDATLVRLRKYVMRAKVKIESVAGRLAIGGVTDDPNPRAARSHQEIDGTSIIAWPAGHGHRLIIAPGDSSFAKDAAFEHEWHRADIRGGLPQVYPQTHEVFVAQMLNVDLLGGVSFDKGCYTGQEIVARAHFRGTVKRRMVGFSASCAPPSPGARILSGAGHAGDVVDAVATAGGCELLAVISLEKLGDPLQVADAPGSELTRLELPYAVS